MISEKAPAKINLSLDVLNKRSDGFHELEMVMTTIDLADRIDLCETAHSAIHVASSSGVLPSDERNLAYLAAARLKERYGISQGVSIYIQKKIPIAAGLAGGSSDAAATLRGLNRLWHLGLTLDELAVIGAEIGSDVPFCLYGGTALARGRGEKLQQLPPPPPCWVVLAKPPISVSTKEVFQTLQVEDIRDHPRTPLMVQALREQNYEAMCKFSCNVLESVTMAQHPEVKAYKNCLLRFGVDMALMSGSGPTVFALLNQDTRVNRVVNALRGFCNDVYAVRMLREGVQK
ncbi:4-(cytidine 5'-diphospho)-2-C-methyl-D-erythritol kinase [Numidum massiliense]|uniref:4-(cytidine 5'-diphospho)-2-C-methyl-D-erythritol kinase n=1 Tax=Numidum massiliense TaxID=1522315 RepID=UPI0006D57FA4|nr:4-(cytidine 5'-diphospho)-2-C-methyl-D-erythritol kinase [Numidum massiliense]